MANYTGYLTDKDGNKLYADIKPIDWTNGTEIKTNESINGKPIYKKYIESAFNGPLNVTLVSGVDKMIGYELMVKRDGMQYHFVNAHLLNAENNIEHLSPIFYNVATHSILTYITNTSFTTASFYGFIYYTKLSD